MEALTSSIPCACMEEYINATHMSLAMVWFLWLWIPCGYMEAHGSYGCGFHVDIIMESHGSYGCGFHVDIWSHMVPMAVDSMWIYGGTWFLWLWIPCGYMESHGSYGCGFHVDIWSHMVPMSVGYSHDISVIIAVGYHLT